MNKEEIKQIYNQTNGRERLRRILGLTNYGMTKFLKDNAIEKKGKGNRAATGKKKLEQQKLYTFESKEDVAAYIIAICKSKRKNASDNLINDKLGGHPYHSIGEVVNINNHKILFISKDSFDMRKTRWTRNELANLCEEFVKQFDKMTRKDQSVFRFEW